MIYPAEQTALIVAGIIAPVFVTLIKDVLGWEGRRALTLTYLVALVLAAGIVLFSGMPTSVESIGLVVGSLKNLSFIL